MLTTLRIRGFCRCIFAVFAAAVACSFGAYSSERGDPFGSESLGQRLDQLSFDFIAESENFTSIAVTALLQDRHGFIWIGTRDGLQRYDGVRFKEYRHADGRRHGLADNFVERLYEDRSGRIWITTRRGVCWYDEAMDRFVTLALGDEVGPVGGVVENAKGELILLTESGALFRYRENEERLELARRPDWSVAKSLLWDERFGYIIGGTFGIKVLDESFVETASFGTSMAFGSAQNGFVGTLGRSGESTLWFGTNRSGTWTLDLVTGALEKVPSEHPEEALIGSIYVDADENVFIGSTAGIKIHEAETGRVHSYQWNEYERGSLQKGTVHSVLEDRQGNLWVGTTRGGLSVARNAKAFSSMTRSRANGSGLTKEKVTAIEEDRFGNLWIGYHNEGLDRIDAASGERTYFNPYSERPGAFGRGTVWAVEESSDGELWFGSSWHGLQRLNPDGRTFERFEPDPNDPHAIHGSDVRRILEDESGNLWLALHGAGLDYYHRDTGRFESYAALTRPWVEDLALDSSGNLWVASSDGLSFLPKGEKEFVDYTSNPEDEYTLSDRHVVCLMVDRDDTVWAGTMNGLCSLRKGESRFRRFGLESGLPSLSIRSIVESANGGIWVATATGLARFDRASERFRRYDRSDGLVSNEFVIRSHRRVEDGSLLFGSERGITRFHPGRIGRNETPPEVVITGVVLSNERLDVSEEEDAPLKRNPVVLDRLVLQPGQNSFGFEFAALNFIGSQRNQFAYRLEGFDGDWISIGNRSECSYTNIDPGRYVFRVKASNNDGVWNESGASMEVVVRPHYWQALWFKLLLLVLAAVGIVVVFRLRVAGLARQKALLLTTVSERTKDLRDALAELKLQRDQVSDQNLELLDHRENLEELVRQRTEELVLAKERAEESDRLKSAFLENISHEIRTPMNAILGFVNILKQGGEVENRDEYMEIIESNGETLLELIDDLIELSRLEAEEVELKPTETDLNYLFKKQAAWLIDSLEERGKSDVSVRLDLETGDAEPCMALVDSERLEQALNQLLDNAAKFTDKGEIALGFRTCSDRQTTLEVFVNDTGIGIPADKVGSIFESFRKIRGERKRLYRGTGLGLAIVKRLAILLGGDIEVRSVFGEGSEFEMRLPVRQLAEAPDRTGGA